MQAVPTFTQILGTGQVLIPAGTRAFSINVLSGQATINAIVCPAPYAITIMMPDSKVILDQGVPPIAVGATGVGNKIVAYWNN